MKEWRQKLYDVLSSNFLAEQFSWLLVVPFLFALGIALFFALPTEPNIWISLGIFEAWLLIFYLCRYKNMHYFFIGGLIILCGFLNIQARTVYQTRHIEPIKEQRLTYLRGQIKDISLSDKGKRRLLLQNAADYDKPLKGEYRVTLGYVYDDEIDIGKCVEMAATLFPNRRVPVRNGFQLDRKYFYEGLSATGYVNSEVFVTDCPDKTGKKDFYTNINFLRKQTAAYIDKVLPPQQAGVADALIVGDKTHILSQISENYRNSGLAHFLAVSGLHLGSIAALVFFCIRLLVALFPFLALRYDSKKFAAGAAILFAGLYLLMSGMAVPAQRAFIMTAAVLIGVIFNRQAISLRMVSFAALVILIIEPQVLISVSFQMSFAAVYALVAFYENYAAKISAWAPKHNFLLKILWYLCGIVIADFVASMATLPFALYHFHRAAVYTSLGNLLSGPLIAFWLMPAILLCLITLPLNMAYYPLKILGSGIEVINNITDYVAHLPYSVWYNDSLSFWGLVFIVAGAYWLCVWRQSWRRWGIVPIAIGVMSVFMANKQPDMVFSPDLTEIAVRDNQGNMLWLPYKHNRWIENLWQENVKLRSMNKNMQNDFKSALANPEKQEITGIDLRCNKDSCVYKDKVEFSRGNMLKINGKEADFISGGYIYAADKAEIEYFSDSANCRIWQSCYEK